jgi:hypothetical protein
MAESKIAGLSEAEQKQFDKLAAKAAAASPHGPAVRIGEPYVALTNISLPRRGQESIKPAERMNDLVPAGETVYLTPEEVALLERHEGKDGRRISVIRRKSEVDNNNPPRPHPSYLSGPLFRPGTPPPGTDLPRPDPAGSTRVVEMTVPETAQPQPGAENVQAGPNQDAVDILPGGQLARDDIRQGADQDLMAAVKAQNPQITAQTEPGTRGRR